MTDQYDINPNGHYMHRDWHAMYADLLSAYRAALARAEAAEAEAARLQYDLDRQLYRADARAEEAEAERNALRAELGTALDHLATAAHYPEVLLAAQQWRPVTEDWPPYNERVIIGHGGGYGGGWSAFARRVRTDNRDGDDWLMDDDTTLAFESAVVAMRRPLPPRPTGDDALTHRRYGPAVNGAGQVKGE